MGDVGAEAPGDGTPAPRAPDQRVPVEHLTANPNQPRKVFDEGALRDLANSIAERGIIQPLIVRPHQGEAGVRYQIVAGERRWRAAQMAQMHEVPVLIRELSDQEVVEIAIIENIQRADLNAIEEALGYRDLMNTHNRTQEEVAQALGKSRSHIANTLRLLRLPFGVQAMVQRGKLSAGHARALVTAENAEALAEVIVAKGLSVREAEKLAKAGPPQPKAPKPAAPAKDADTRALEGDLSAHLRLKVSVDADSGGEAGRLTIRYKSLDDLDDLCRILTASDRDVSR